MGKKKKNANRLLVENSERKGLLGRPRRRWVINIEVNLGGMGWDGVVLTGLVWLRIGNNGKLL
jgi:hypothetical protein